MTANAIGLQGCSTCVQCMGTLSDDTLCRSKRHARFMDIAGSHTYKDRLRKSGCMALKTAEFVGSSCPSWEGGKKAK